MPSQVMELKSDKTTAEIKAIDGLLDVQLPLTLAGWNIVESFEAYGNRPVVIRSADGEAFLGEVTDTDELTYVVTVELTS